MSSIQTEIETEISEPIEIIETNETIIDTEKDEVDPWADLVEDEKIEESSQTSILIESEVYTPESADSIVEDNPYCFLLLLKKHLFLPQTC